MFWRSNKGKDQTDNTINTADAADAAPAAVSTDTVGETDGTAPADDVGKTRGPAVGGGMGSAAGQTGRQTMSREEFFAENEEAKKMYEDIMSLRRSLETLKKTDEELTSHEHEEGTGKDGGDKAGKIDTPQDKASLYLEETAEIIAAKQAIIEQARKDAEKARQEREEARRREIAMQEEHQKVLEAQRRVAQSAEEAERKRQEALQADKRAKEISRKKALDDMEAERHARNLASAGGEPERETGARADTGADGGVDSDDASAAATPEELTALFSEIEEVRMSVNQKAELEKARQALLSTQQEQGRMIDQAMVMTGLHTEMLATEQQTILSEKQEQIREEQKKLEELLEYKKQQRMESVERANAERLIREQRSQLERLIREQRAHEVRAQRLAKAKKKQEEKAARQAEKERARQARREALARAKAEEAKRLSDAELGGGIVNVQGVKISTAIQDVGRFSWRDILGLADKKERRAETEEEKEALREERERRKEDARAAADMMAKQRRARYEESDFGRRMQRFKAFCDRYKKPLLAIFAAVVLTVSGVVGVFNYCTAYEYSYNGKALGIVREKDAVLRITDLVQGALTKEKNMDVIIDAKDDIAFKRVSALGDVKIDSSEEVLKRLTYMGDLNVKAYGIYVNGQKAGAVESKEVAAEVLQDIKDRYASGREGSEIEEAVIIEQIDVRESNTDLQDLSSREDMVNKLCTSGQKETLHKVVAGETLADICKLYSLTEQDIMEDNENIDPRRLEVGSVIVIRQNAPIITVKITEMVTYEEKIEFEVQKKSDDTIYEGDTELQQEGRFGLSEITARLVLVNGEAIEETELVTTVKEEPVTEIILVGAMERPPTIGDGKFIWPLTGGYTLTSNYGSRWGRQHQGIDLGTSSGNDVLAADGGTVTYAGYSGAYGYLVTIDHQNGMESRYAHNSSLLVSTGDEVYEGQHIAESGNTGRSTGPHLHFEIRINGSPQNPLDYLP